ncbi:MAG: methylhydantoinase [Deltaproteobacteria bacterium SM23_61]|nr:MAG: methylhydantoinase [Deltaproteobacteria bacterium SM23_61]
MEKIGVATEYQVGIDIGGTFTDVVILEPASGRLSLGKSLTSTDNPARAVIQVLREMLGRDGIAARQVAKAIHGTTLVTNLIIERKGALTGLLTSRGFRDALEIGREMRYDIYDIFLELPRPLVPRRLRLEVGERLNHQGQVLVSLTPEEAERAVSRLLDLGVESVAVSLLHSFRNPAHERMLRDLILARRPGFPVSLSSEVSPEVREYERTSTTVANAYAMPAVRRYMEILEKGLAELGMGGRLYIILSNGGITSPQTATLYPLRLLESGPAGGALVAAWVGEQTGQANIISFDMGGTTAKTCIIQNGNPLRVNEFEVGRVYRFKKGSGLPVKIPVIEMIEIGAGGGSIASIGPLGLLKVGPESAGADPGPACYGRGGKEPTVTDADLILGYLDPHFFLGGEMQLDSKLAEAALQKKIAGPLNLSLERAAWGVHEVVNENMANASRIHAVEKGIDPRRFSLVAFGGAGPVHAYQVAEKLRLETIIVPAAAGVCSAFGFLLAPMSFDLSRSYIIRLEELQWERLNSIYAELEARGRELLLDAGVPLPDMQFIRSADMRYAGQGFEISVVLPAGPYGPGQLEAFRRAFEKEYQGIYQRLCPEISIEGVNWRLVATGPNPQIGSGTWWSRGASLGEALKGKRRIYIPGPGRYEEAPVYDRYRLPVGVKFDGPAVVEERESTLVMNGPATAWVEPSGSLMVRLVRD